MKYFQIINQTNNDKVVIEWSYNELLLHYNLKNELEMKFFVEKTLEKFQRANPRYDLSIKEIEETRKPQIPFYCLPNFGWS